VRVNVEGTSEEVISTNRTVARPYLSLAFDAAHDKLFSAGPTPYLWFDKDGTNPGEVPRMNRWANIRGFMLDEDHQKIYFSNGNLSLLRANPDGSQVETLVSVPAGDCPDGFVRRISDIAMDHTRGHLYWAGSRVAHSAVWPTICRVDLPPLLKARKLPAPPRITSIEPAEQRTGAKISLSGDGLADAIAVTFIDDSTGVNTAAEFTPLADGQLGVTIPRLEQACQRPVIVVQTPSGVTMTLGTDILAPKHGGTPYLDVRTIPLEGDSTKLIILAGASNKPYHHERAKAGTGARVLLQPGVLSGNLELAVVYAMRGSHINLGPKGMVTGFAENESHVSVPALNSQIEAVIYHEPFAVVSHPLYHDPTVKLIPVPAIRPSFPETPFRYLAN
jgi:hypothetical protein